MNRRELIVGSIAGIGATTIPIAVADDEDLVSFESIIDAIQNDPRIADTLQGIYSKGYEKGYVAGVNRAAERAAVMINSITASDPVAES